VRGRIELAKRMGDGAPLALDVELPPQRRAPSPPL
jgi:hypothetical protein